MKKWLFIIDVAKCENCNNCMLACKDEHVGNDLKGYSFPQPDHGQYWIQINAKERGQFPLIDVAYLPVPCMHCDNAPCIKASKDGALYKRKDGIVIIDPVKSVGQREIVNACPYHVIWWNEALSIPQKCTLCAHLLDNGWSKTRCVQSCPTGALSIHYLTDIEAKSMTENDRLEVYLPQYKTKPRVYYKNLFRFTKCFIAGSISLIEKDQVECAEGAYITLFDNSGVKRAESITDNFGDFKFDDLDENSGKYTIRIDYKSYEPKVVEIELKQSMNLGTIKL
jgi:Fe-S-cluster-containing dehydrogenase component